MSEQDLYILELLQSSELAFLIRFFQIEEVSIDLPQASSHAVEVDDRIRSFR